MEGNLTQYPGGEVEVNFESDRSKASYQCVLLDDESAPPTVIPCKTHTNDVAAGFPYYLCSQ